MGVKLYKRRKFLECLSLGELKEHISNCLVDICVEKDIYYVTEIGLRTSVEGYFLEMGSNHCIYCNFPFDHKCFFRILQGAYRKYFKETGLEKCFYFDNAHVDGMAILISIFSIN